jgi:hypothetical protein
MYSPNYWDNQDNIGHRHVFFMLNDCKNDESPNGYYNEYLKQELYEFKRVFEALSSKSAVEYADEQLNYIMIDIDEELDNISQLVEGESSKILLLWVRDSINRILDNYKL